MMDYRYYSMKNRIIMPRKVFKGSHASSLPAIHVPLTQRLPHPPPPPDEIEHEEENEVMQVTMLEQWTNRLPQKLILAQPSKPLRRRCTRITQLTEPPSILQARVFLSRLQDELDKVETINYQSIFKNLQYCASLYSNFYDGLLTAVDEHIKNVQERFNTLSDKLLSQRLSHVKSLEKAGQKENVKSQIGSIRDEIARKEIDIEPLEKLLARLKDARQVILRHCLRCGYDVRSEGLVWIVAQLTSDPLEQDFPIYLSPNEIQFILDRLKKEHEVAERAKAREEEERIKLNTHRSTIEVYEMVVRRKKRELSMIKEGQILEALKQHEEGSFRAEGHRYITEDVLNMARNQLPAVKTTKYEIIYKETMRKMNEFTMAEIYRKPSKKERKNSKRYSMNTLKLLDLFETRLQDSIKGGGATQEQSQEESQLQIILKNLRYEGYHCQGPSRNAVSVICALVGWKKAKDIIERDMKYLLI